MALATSRIDELALLIQSKTSLLSTYCAENDIPMPSMEGGSPSTRPLPPPIAIAREQILAATTELQALVAGPLNHLSRLLSPAVNVLIGLQAIYRYKIALVIETDEEVSFCEIAKRCGLEESDVRRLLRVATANYVFQERHIGYISHSSISLVLAKNPQALQWLGYVCDELWPSETRTLDAMQKWPNSQEPNETGFALSEPSGQAFFEVLKHDEGRARRLADSMSYLQSSPSLSPQFLIRDLQWGHDSTPNHLVDLGGSDGSIDIALLRAYPNLRCTVQDLPDVIAKAIIPEDLGGRLTFTAHDFFNVQPVKGADVYLLRSVLHDWSDKYVVKILRNLIPALKPKSQIILNEVCLPEPNVLPIHVEQLVRGYDLAMKAKFNSKERDVEDWRAVLSAADTRFRLGRITASQGSVLSVIEVDWLVADTSR